MGSPPFQFPQTGPGTTYPGPADPASYMTELHHEPGLSHSWSVGGCSSSVRRPNCSHSSSTSSHFFSSSQTISFSSSWISCGRVGCKRARHAANEELHILLRHAEQETPRNLGRNFAEFLYSFAHRFSLICILEQGSNIGQNLLRNGISNRSRDGSAQQLDWIGLIGLIRAGVLPGMSWRRGAQILADVG